MILRTRTLWLDTVLTHRLCFVLFFLLLFAGYAFNSYGTASDSWFKNHQRDSESLVIGRMMPKSDVDFFANGGFLGRLDLHGDLGSATYDHYLKDQPPLPSASYGIYTGQLGLQGYALTIVDRALRTIGVDGPSRLWLMYTLTAAALAAVLSYLLTCFKREFGLVAAFFGLALLIFSPWLTVFARNLYWVPFTWFLPIASAWYFYARNPPASGRRLFSALLWIGFLIFTKALCGLEYITAVAGATACVVGYGLIKANIRLKVILIYGFATAAAIVSAVIGAIIVQVLAIGAMRGSIAIGWNDFINRIAYRSYGDPLIYDEKYAESLGSSINRVLSVYWTEGRPILNIGSIFSANAAQIIIPLVTLIIISMAYMLWRCWNEPDRRRQIIATIFLIISSVIASLSWLVVAKGHSYIHTHMNYVLWHLSILLFAGPISIYAMRLIAPRGIAEIAVASALVAGILLYSSTPSRPDGDPYMVLETEKGTVSLFKEGVFFDFPCASIADGERFFLHVGGVAQFLPASSRSAGFLNLDFFWTDRRTTNVIGEWLSGRCHAFVVSPSIQLDHVPIRFIRFGQFKHDGDKSQSWSVLISEQQLHAFAAKIFSIGDISDSQWERGVHKYRAGLLVSNNLDNRQSLAAYTGIVIDKVKIPFEEISLDEAWITFFFDREMPFPADVSRELNLYSE